MALFAILSLSSSGTLGQDLVVAKVQRTIDLTSHISKIASSVTIENSGKTAAKSFLFAVDPVLAPNLAFIGALHKSGEEEQKLEVRKEKDLYKITLPSSLEAGKAVTIDVETVFNRALKPYPAQIAQSEKQFVQFSGNAYFLSPYKTTTQTTVVNCPSSSIESFSKVKPATQAESSITYGPYENKDAHSSADITVHYENNSPFLTVTSMERLIEVSHWGNIAVEETVDMGHTGAILKGAFSRYDYQRNQDGVSSIKSFKTVLPSTARDVYYRDEIGNISTSHLKELDDMIEVELRPRFPLFGGWKTHYMLGYNVPSYQYLYNSGDKYVLKMRFVDHVYDDQVVENLKVKIILPEGATNIKFRAPYAVNRGKDELHFTYLDTFGRPVVIARKTDLVEQHIQDFELEYTFQKAMLLQEPMLVVGAFYLLFLIVIIYVRMDFSISKDEASESRMRVASLIEQVQTLQDRRSALYQSYDDTINKYKASKDAASFNTNRKKVDADYKAITQQIAGAVTKLKAEGTDVIEKVQELQRYDTQVREQITMAIQYAEKLMLGRLAKQQYVDYEATVKNKREEIINKMESLLNTL